MTAVRKGICLIITTFVFALPVLSHPGDPASSEYIGFSDVSEDGNESLLNLPIPLDPVTPTFTIDHTENGSEVTIGVTSSVDLFGGWVPVKGIWSVGNFDDWWLNTRIATDGDNSIYAAVKLYEYSNPSVNFDMYVLENNGDVSEENLDWNGPGNNPLIINNPAPNIYLRQPTLDREGVVDPDNNTYIFYNNGGSNIILTKLDPDGNEIISDLTIITGANAWSNEIRTDVAPDGRVYIVWSKDMHDITYAYSDDGGGAGTWSLPTSICYNAADQMNKPQVCCDSNGNVHVIWQHWTGGSNLLAYMKLLPNGIVSIDESFLTPASNQVWAAMMDIDEQNNLHIVWAKSSQQVTSAYYTKINGNLDGGGDPMSDEDLTIVQEAPFLVNENIRYPKCVVDTYMNVHAIFEQGQYGCNQPKAVNYRKMNGIPLLRVVCPDDSVLFVEMTGSGINWEGTFAPPMNGMYTAGISGSDAVGNTGFDTYVFEYPATGMESQNGPSVSGISCSPNPFNGLTSVSYILSEAVNVSVEIYSITGRLVDTLVKEEQQSGCHSVNWNASDMNPGIYLCRISSGVVSETLRCVVVAE